jgi:hypothetical protein
MKTRCDELEPQPPWALRNRCGVLGFYRRSQAPADETLARADETLLEVARSGNYLGRILTKLAQSVSYDI